MKREYKANRGGHAPGHLRDAFADALDIKTSESPAKWYENLNADTISFDDPKMQKRWKSLSPRDKGIWLIGQLWNCTDIMPSGLCDTLDLHPGSTYASGVRNLRKVMN